MSSSCFRGKDGWIEREDGFHYFIDCQEVSEEVFLAKHPPRKSIRIFGTETPTGWPIHSEALAVHPTQIQEARDVAKAKGIPTDFDSSGRPIFTSSRHFREYAKRHGFRHKGYA